MINYCPVLGLQMVFILDDILKCETGLSLLPSQQAVSKWNIQGGVSPLILSRSYLKFCANVKNPLDYLKFVLDDLGVDQSFDVMLWHKWLTRYELK